MSYLLLFVAAVIAEVTSVVIVSGYLGLWTLAALAVSVGVGLLVLSGRGVAIVRDVVQAMSSGGSAAAALVDGALVAGAGLLLIIPGFASDVAALLLLVPPLRAPLTDRIARGIRGRARAVGVGPDGVGEIIDVEATERPAPPDPDPPRLTS